MPLSPLFVAGAFVLAAACAPHHSPGAPEAKRTSWPQFSSAAPPLRDPPPSVAQLRELAVPGFLPAVIVVPPGNAPRPLVVAAHGAGGAPEWDCDFWARLTSERAFVLCLRGARISAQGGFYFPQHHALAAELNAAVAASRAEFPNILPRSGMYVGFSQGASMGSLIVSEHAAESPYVVLVEGFERWNDALARAFAERGGKAVLFACGSKACAEAAGVSRRSLERSNVAVRVEYASGAGHTAGGAVATLLQKNLSWLWADDPAWR